jgi:Uma2 family endonuclease
MNDTLATRHRLRARPLHAPLLSEADFLRLPGEDKADLIHGRLYVMAPPSRRHEKVVSFLAFLLDGFVSARAPGEVYGSKSPIRIDERSTFEPDVVFVATRRLTGIRADGLITGGADIAVEVASPSTRRRDYVDKRDGYERAGVAEYWIVDPMRGEARFYRIGAGGLYDEVTPPPGEPFRSQSAPGFELLPSALFDEPLPNRYELLRELLA